MEDEKKTLEDKVVFKYSADGIALYTFLCFLFVMAGFWMLDHDEVRNRLVALLSIVLFGGVGVFFLAFKSWKPILIVSKEGVAQPTFRKEKFVSWAEINEIRFKVQSFSNRGFTTTVRYIGVYTFEGRQEDSSFGYLFTELSKFFTGWREMPTLLIKNQKMFSGVKCEEIVEVMQMYHAEFVSGLLEDEKGKYEDVFHHTITRQLKNSINFVGDDNSLQENVNQENINQDDSLQEDSHRLPKVSDHINWEKLSTEDEGNRLERFLRKINQ